MDICTESAEAILALVKSCNGLSEQHLPCFVPLFVQAAGITEVDIVARNAMMGGAGQLVMRRASSVTQGSDDERVYKGRSLAERAIEELVILSNVYPSARKCMLELQGGLGRQTGSQVV